MYLYFFRDAHNEITRKLLKIQKLNFFSIDNRLDNYHFLYTKRTFLFISKLFVSMTWFITISKSVTIEHFNNTLPNYYNKIPPKTIFTSNKFKLRKIRNRKKNTPQSNKQTLTKQTIRHTHRIPHNRTLFSFNEHHRRPLKKTTKAHRCKKNSINKKK